MNTIERFVCLIYHAGSTKYEVNKCRRQLFTQYGRQLKNLSPRQYSLKQYVLRAAFPEAFVWDQSLVPSDNLPSSDQWEQNKQGNNFVPYWMTLPIVFETCKDLTKCGCKSYNACLDVAPVRKLDYHEQNFLNVVECVIEHKVILCCF